MVHQHFRPEFLNRIDETVVFEALSPAQLREIARLQVLHSVYPLRSLHSEIGAPLPDVHVFLAYLISEKDLGSAKLPEADADLDWDGSW